MKKALPDIDIKDVKLRKTAKSSAGPPFVPMEQSSDVSPSQAKSDPSPVRDHVPAKAQGKKKKARVPDFEQQRQLQEQRLSNQVNPVPVQMRNMMLPSPSLQLVPEKVESIPKQDPSSLSMEQKAIPSPQVRKTNQDLLKKKAVQRSPYTDASMREAALEEMKEYQSWILQLAENQEKGEPMPKAFYDSMMESQRMGGPVPPGIDNLNQGKDGDIDREREARMPDGSYQDRRTSMPQTNVPSMTDIAKLKPSKFR
jgi:hypothetical protein